MRRRVFPPSSTPSSLARLSLFLLVLCYLLHPPGPYSAIHVGAASPIVPSDLLDQVSLERLLSPVDVLLLPLPDASLPQRSSPNPVACSSPSVLTPKVSPLASSSIIHSLTFVLVRLQTSSKSTNTSPAKSRPKRSSAFVTSLSAILESSGHRSFFSLLFLCFLTLTNICPSHAQNAPNRKWISSRSSPILF